MCAWKVEPPNSPLISVVMPVYNSAGYVAEAINSILAQTHINFEFIIVDDGSTDGTANIVREFAARDARIRPLFATHGGRSRAANLAIAQARGEWMARIDADDIALPHRLAVQLDWVQRTGVDICGSNVKGFGTDTRLIWVPESHQAICHELLFRLGLFQSSVMIRTEIAKTHLYDEQAAFEDYEMWTRLALRYRLGNVSQVLLMYRSHENQSHVVESTAFGNDVVKYSRRLFAGLFPDVTEADQAAVADLVARRPAPSIKQLERSGHWLVRLAQTPDNFLRKRMANRWWAACHRSTGLGWQNYWLYRRIAPQFNAISTHPTWALGIMSALRLNPASRLVAWFRRALFRKN